MQVNRLIGNVGALEKARLFFRNIVLFLFPKIGKIFKLSFVDDDVTRFFTTVIRQAIEHRRQTGTKRNDFIDLLLSAIKETDKRSEPAKPEGEIDQFERDAAVSGDSLQGMSAEELEGLLISNLFVFFFAGFDTSSTFLSIIMWVCATYPEEQDKLREEIEEYVSKHGSNNLDYNTIQDMPYLDMFIYESLRTYPIALIERLCIKDYKVPGTNGIIPKGTIVQIPGFSFMKDDRYWDDPETFNPQNFSPEKKAERNPYAFLIFGQGPRNCIGMRFALLMLKLCMVKILTNYKVVPSERTPKDLAIDPFDPSGSPKGGTWVKLEQL